MRKCVGVMEMRLKGPGVALVPQEGDRVCPGWVWFGRKCSTWTPVCADSFWGENSLRSRLCLAQFGKDAGPKGWPRGIYIYKFPVGWWVGCGRPIRRKGSLARGALGVSGWPGDWYSGSVYRLLCNLVGAQNLAIRGGSKEGRIDIGMINFASANMLFGVTAKWRKKEWDETR